MAGEDTRHGPPRGLLRGGVRSAIKSSFGKVEAANERRHEGETAGGSAAILGRRLV